MKSVAHWFEAEKYICLEIELFALAVTTCCQKSQSEGESSFVFCKWVSKSVFAFPVRLRR